MLVWLCAYTSLGMALYASITYDLHSWATGLGTTSSLLVGVYNLGSVEAVDKHGLRAFVVSLLMFAVGSLTAYVSYQPLMAYLHCKRLIQVRIRIPIPFL